MLPTIILALFNICLNICFMLSSRADSLVENVCESILLNHCLAPYHVVKSRRLKKCETTFFFCENDRQAVIGRSTCYAFTTLCHAVQKVTNSIHGLDSRRMNNISFL